MRSDLAAHTALFLTQKVTLLSDPWSIHGHQAAADCLQEAPGMHATGSCVLSCSLVLVVFIVANLAYNVLHFAYYQPNLLICQFLIHWQIDQLPSQLFGSR